MCINQQTATQLFDRLGLYSLTAILSVSKTRENDVRGKDKIKQLSMNHAELNELLLRVAQGDEAAFSRFYDLTSPVVFGLAARIMRDPMLAEDVVADCYFQIWQQASRYCVDRGHALSWCLLIARSRALDALRRRRDVPVSGEPVANENVDAAYDTMDLIEQLESNNAVRVAIGALSDKQQKLVALAFFSDMSHSEIALHTGIPLGSVKSGLRESMVVLRKLLGPSRGAGMRLS